ncbi:MAG TPA: hypothetical protein VGB24_23740 [Longimicrobium sp.]|jgi:hypothetical protein|uniref:hypothetical protein n=1 Tax=Longimicrobium sp. TaxID=2029185 RepID=UPI002ED7C7AC
MSLKRTLLVAVAAVLPMLAACVDNNPAASIEPIVQAPTSEMNQATGEPEAMNAPTADRVFTFPTSAGSLNFAEFPEPCDPNFEICDECDPAVQYGCEPCDPTNQTHWCYEPPCTITPIITTYGTTRTGDEPNAGLEANGVGSTSCGGYLVLIGVGMRMDGNDNITTLHLKYQRVYSDGSFGPTELRRYGSDPTHGLEGYAEALPGEAIVGLGIGSQYSHNVRTIRIWKRPIGLTSAGVRTSGSITAESFGYSPGGVLDTSYVIPLANTNQVYVGAGARGHDHEVKTLAHHIGTLN